MWIFLLVLLLMESAVGLYLALKPKQYDGVIVVNISDEGKKVITLHLEGDPENIESKNTISFKVLSKSN